MAVTTPKPGERWRATYEGIVQEGTPSEGAFFSLKHETDSAPEEFWDNNSSWIYEKLAGTEIDRLKEENYNLRTRLMAIEAKFINGCSDD